MNQKEIISSLLTIEKEIRKCYQDIIKIECFEKNQRKKITLFNMIREYVELEKIMFQKLKDKCITKQDWIDVSDNLTETYSLPNQGMIKDYLSQLDTSIIARRLIIKVDIEKDLVSDTSDEVDEDDDFALLGNLLSSTEDNQTFYQDIFFPLLEEEDSVRLIMKMDEMIFQEKDKIKKQKLCQLKYDMIFLNENFEEILVNEYKIPSLSLVDSKKRASLLLQMDDEMIEKIYDVLRANEMFYILTELSQERNSNMEAFRQKLHFILFDIYAETISDDILFQIISDFEDTAQNSYKENIAERKKKIIDIIYPKYQDRLFDFESTELTEEEIEDEVKQTQENQKEKIKKTSKNSA